MLLFHFFVKKKDKAVKRVVSLSEKKNPQTQTKATARKSAANSKRGALKRAHAAQCPTASRDGCPTWAVDVCGGEGEPFSRCYRCRFALHSFLRVEQVYANYPTTRSGNATFVFPPENNFKIADTEAVRGT